MKECNRCLGVGKLENDEDAEECYMCSGTGEVEEGCSCAARNPFECCCDGWSDVNLEDWIDD